MWPVAKSGLLGPFDLSFDSIAAHVTRCSPGVFALGFADGGRGFGFYEIGRAELDIGSDLRGRIGAQTLFKFAYAAGAEAAFIKQCELFHSFRPPGNRMHPVRVAGSLWICPWCRPRGR